MRAKLGGLISVAVLATVLSAGHAGALVTLDCSTGGSLQAAIDAVVPGTFERIEFSGTCTENLDIPANSDLEIIGLGTDAVIDGSGAVAPAVLIGSDATVLFANVTIAGGTGDFGGGIDSFALSLTIVDSVIEGNTASTSGGGIDTFGDLFIFRSSIQNNSADGFGGGLVSRDVGIVLDSDINNNSASNGGGVYNPADADLAIFSSAIFLNDATVGFGGLGGGIYNAGFMDIIDSVVLDNDTLGGAGGGLYSATTGDVFVDESLFDGNTAGGGGGAYNSGGVLLINESWIQNHDSSAGGGLYNELDGSLSIVRSNLLDNSGTTGGGGLFSDSGTVVFADSLVYGNVAPGVAVGGGMLNMGTSDLVFSHSTLSDNTASSGGGVHNEATFTSVGSTIAGNTATAAATGGGINNSGGTATIESTLVADNTSVTGPDCGGVVTSEGNNLIENASGCTLTPLGSDLVGLDPLLEPLADNGGPTMTHAIPSNSPAVDHIPVLDCSEASDQRGIVRPRGSGCDIGAYELDSEPDVVILVEPDGRWHIRQDGLPDYTFFYGVPGDVPLFGDWDGDGIDTPGMWRQGPGGGFAYLTDTLPDDGGVGVAEFDFFFGAPGDEVFSGDWNGDGVDTLGINRGGHIFLADSNGSEGDPVPTDYDFFFGVPGDRAFGGDPDGDGADSVFLYRASDGFVYFTNETPVGPGGVATTADNFFFGIASDSFVSGDWDGDLDDTAGIFRGSNTTIYLSNTNASNGAPAPTDDSYVWGAAGWSPVAGVWK